jgi:hypothetical protein
VAEAVREDVLDPSADELVDMPSAPYLAPRSVGLACNKIFSSVSLASAWLSWT